MSERERKNKRLRAVKIGLFAVTLAAFAVIGLLLPLRPETSQAEKRTLAAFPEPALSGVWDGSFFSGVDTWYSDTYPIRERLYTANHALQEHYGLRSTQLIGGVTGADAIPDAIPDAAAQSPTPAAEQTPVPTPSPVPTAPPDGTVHQIGEMVGGVYITDNCAYGLYQYSQAGADAYIDTMNQVYQNVKDKVNLYVLLAPISASVMLDESVLADMNCSNEGDAIDYVYSRFDPGIHAVDVYDNLRAHNSEYIYFHTDHHWTQLGSYYAYEKFCESKGWTPHPLTDFRTGQFSDFYYLGSYYAQSNQSAALKANPDTIYAYYPMGTNDMTFTTRDGVETPWHIINDEYAYDNAEWYGIYSGADQPFSVAHNPQITDGSAIMVVKDSFGNCFIPWLIDHYEYVYWVDFRYTNNTVSQMVEDYGIQDVLYMIALANATGGLCNELFADIGQ